MNEPKNTKTGGAIAGAAFGGGLALAANLLFPELLIVEGVAGILLWTGVGGITGLAVSSGDDAVSNTFDDFSNSLTGSAALNLLIIGAVVGGGIYLAHKYL